MTSHVSQPKPWLSVVMPVHRGERWIRSVLGSLVTELTRGTEGIEILLIDGSPTRDTLDIAAEFTARLPLQLHHRPDLTSWQAKTNFGVATAGADHICWLGVDDLWLPGRIAAIRHWISTAPDVVLHLAPSAIIDATDRVLGLWHCPLPIGIGLCGTEIMQHLLVQNFIAAPAPVFRKDAWQRCGGLDQSLWYTADWDLWLKLASSGTTVYHDDVTIGFRIHGGSQTSSQSRDAGDFTRQMTTVLERHLPGLTGLVHGAHAKRHAGEVRVVEHVARVSIRVNTALSAAAHGNRRQLGAAVAAVLRLGPTGMHRYFRDSRITERLLPRLRATLSGRL